MISIKAVIEPNSKYTLLPLNYASRTNQFESSSLNVKNVSSRVIELTLEQTPIKIFKFSNSGIKYWDDFWTEYPSNSEVDPLIENLSLESSFYLNAVNIFSNRESLKSINLSKCESLLYLSIPRAPQLEEVILDGCIGLDEVHFGFNKSIRHISLKDCDLKEKTIENILSEYIPTKSDYSLLNLKGNIIPWGNRRIASKIRMLLFNNINVAWSNNPPEAVIPAEMYSNFLA